MHSNGVHPQHTDLQSWLGACLQGVEGRLAIVRSLAEQWFGVFMRPKTAADGWLLKGLAGWLEGQFVRRYMGRNELAYRSLMHLCFLGHFKHHLDCLLP